MSSSDRPLDASSPRLQLATELFVQKASRVTLHVVPQHPETLFSLRDSSMSGVWPLISMESAALGTNKPITGQGYSEVSNVGVRRF